MKYGTGEIVYFILHNLYYKLALDSSSCGSQHLRLNQQITS